MQRKSWFLPDGRLCIPVYDTKEGPEVMTQKLNLKRKILMGVTLFSMFFGAGNLIFPPYLGAQAGTSAWTAFMGFAMSAVGLPVLGVIAVTLSGGLNALASRVHPRFAFVYILVLYLAIGPCLAIPRTASTSFSMAGPPFLTENVPVALVQFVYTVIFFTAASLVALHPEKLTEYLGKRLTPVLLTLITVLFVAALLRPAGSAAAPSQAYAHAASLEGFLYGYQTMDTLAALNFGMIVALNVQALGICEEKAVMKETVSAGWIAGGLLLAVYAMLNQVGKLSGKAFPGTANGTEVLMQMAEFLFGKAGAVILAAIFVIACFNTCVGLLSCCGKYFSSCFPQIGYRVWVFGFAAVSAVLANVGLDTILLFSVPALNAIYPLAILLIALAFLEKALKRFPDVYPWSALLCGLSSVLTVLAKQGFAIPGLTKLIQGIPGYTAGFGWLLPTILGAGIGMLFSMFPGKYINQTKTNRRGV